MASFGGQGDHDTDKVTQRKHFIQVLEIDFNFENDFVRHEPGGHTIDGLTKKLEIDSFIIGDANRGLVATLRSVVIQYFAIKCSSSFCYGQSDSSHTHDTNCTTRKLTTMKIDIQFGLFEVIIEVKVGSK